ncbi:MAG: hypothetical protein LUD84_01055, partial [Clostridiales bacterium]|nr:hypothetical protein [Clostridiales bacterium]
MKTVKHQLRRLVALALALAMCLPALPGVAAAEDETTYTWTKVTSAPSNWAGEYLLVYEADSTTAYVFDGTTSTNDYVEASVSSSTITADKTNVVTLEAVDDGYVLKNADGDYLYQSSDSNGIATSSNQSTAANYPLTVSVTDEGIDLELSSGPHMRFNAASDQMRFRYYQSGTYTNQQAVTLYALDGEASSGGSTTTETVETPSLTYSETDKTVTFKCATSGVTYYYSYSESGDYTALEGDTLDVSDHIGEILYAYAELDGSKSDINSVELTETEPTVSGYELITGDITSGDQVMIYYPEGGTAITGTASGSKLTGGEVTVADGIMETNNEGEVFTVYVDDDGYLSFVTDEGAYLTSGSTGNSLTLESTSSDYSLWTLESAEESGSYYIKSVNASYSGSAQYIEYYNGFTTYGFSSSKASIYTFQFYYVGHTDAEQPSTGSDDEEEDDGTLTSGTYVIWNPAYGYALSSTTTGSYYAGVAVAENDSGVLSGYGSTEVWTVTVSDDGTLTLEQDGSYMGMNASNYLTFGEADTLDHYTWTVEDAGDGLYYLKDPTSGRYVEWYSNYSDWSTYSSVISGSEGMFALQFTAVEETDDDEDDTVTGTLVDSIAQGDQVVIYYPNGGLAMTGTASSSKLTGVAGTVEDTTLTTTSDALVLTVRETDEGYYTFENGGLYLTSGSTGSSLTLAEKSDYSLWELEETDTVGSFYIKNVNAKYGSNNQYVEYYSGFTTYSFSSSNPTIYVYQFYKTGETEVGVEYDTDSSVVEAIAAWAGSWGDTQVLGDIYAIFGDKYTTDDMLDTNATFTAVVSGSEVLTYTEGSTGGTTLYYMGGTGLGSGTDDYLQFAVSTAGWGDMELSFRMRASNTGSGEWQLQYSTDGETFTDFTTGTYSCSYTSYSSDGSSSAVTLSGDITDGVAKTSIKSATYITFTFDVPDGAENAENLYIRLVPSTTVRANGNADTPSTGGTVRIDSVVLSGSPIVDDSITGYVAVTPDNSEDQAVGTELTLSSSTEDATIYYRFVDADYNVGDWQVYDAGSKPTLDSLPVTLEVGRLQYEVQHLQILQIK